MSLLSKFVFDPIKAAFARAQTSSNPAVAQAGAAAASSYNQVASTIATAANNGITANSAAGIGNTVIGELENGLNAVVDGFITGGLAMAGAVGEALAPEAVTTANVLLTFGEQHALNYVSALFAHARTQVAASAPAATAGKAK